MIKDSLSLHVKLSIIEMFREQLIRYLNINGWQHLSGFMQLSTKGYICGKMNWKEFIVGWGAIILDLII